MAGVARVVRPALALALYLLFGVISLNTATLHPHTAAVWMPAGFAVGWLAVFGLPFFPVVLAGAFTLNLAIPWLTDGNALDAVTLRTALIIAVGNTLEALAGGWFVRRYAMTGGFLESASSAISFAVLGAVVPAMLSTASGALGLATGGLLGDSRLIDITVTWYIANVAGILIFGAATIIVLSHRPEPLGTGRAIEAALLIGALLMFSQTVSGLALADALRDWPKTYMVIPFLLWACFRFGKLVPLVCILLLTATSVLGTMRGLPAFPAESEWQSLIYLQVYLGLMSVVTFVVHGALQESRALRDGLEETVRRRTLRIEQLMTDREEMNTLVAHDLQSPLHSVRGALRTAVDLFDAGQVDAKATLPVLASAADACDTMVERVQNLLRDRRADLNLDENNTGLALGDLIRKILASHGLDVETRGIQVSVMGADDIQLPDPETVALIVDVLVDNALRFSPHGKTVSIRTERRADAVEIAIRDEGPGVPPERRQDLFAPLPPSIGDDEAREHHGIGLYLARKRATSLGGELTYEAPAEGGARFVLTLPLHPTAETG